MRRTTGLATGGSPTTPRTSAAPNARADLEGVSELWICYPLTEEETHQYGVRGAMITQVTGCGFSGVQTLPTLAVG